MLCKLIVFLLIAVQCFSVEITGEQTLILDKFFEQLVKNSEAGYVIYGKKPVCINGYAHEDQFYGEIENHLASVDLREGATLWKKLNLNSSSDILIHLYEGEDSLAKDWVHVLVINRPLFIKTVNNNLTLFQYVLGPSVTAQGLFDKLTDPKQTFHSVLKNDKVLIGIVLGFGTENSLYASRLENIENMLLSSENPPFQSPLCKSRPELQHIASLKDFFQAETRKLEPSFGHESIDQEITTIFNQLEIASLTLARKSPPFVFGCLKNDERTKEFVKELEACQKEINRLLESEDFLETVIRKICPDISFSTKDALPERLSFSEKETAKLPYLIAANIWNTINEESEEYQQSFMKGLQDCQEGLPNDKEHLDDKTYIFSKIYEKSKETELFFKNIEKEKDIVCLEPQKLYFQVLEKGSGPSYKGQRKIMCRSSFKSTTGEILSDTFNTGPATIDLSEVIYGFAKGLSGMQVGEIRQIYIHPNLGYGLLSSADKGGYLTCKIQLLSIDSEDTFELTSSILPKNLEIPNHSEELVRMWNQTHGYSHGYRIWQHYGKGDAELVKKVLIELEKLQGDVDISDVQSQNLLNRLHWNLYHK